jgi:hypothetical protein
MVGKGIELSAPKNVRITIVLLSTKQGTLIMTDRADGGIVLTLD